MKFLNMILILIITQTALAEVDAPQRFSNCGKSMQIIEPANSDGFFYGTDCSTIYVKPAKISKVDVAGFDLLVPELTCRAFNAQTRGVNAEVEAEFAKIESQTQSEEIKLSYRQISEKQNNCRGIEADKKKAIQYIQRAKLAVVNVESEVEDLIESLATCERRCRRVESSLRKAKETHSHLKKAQKKIDILYISKVESHKVCIQEHVLMAQDLDRKLSYQSASVKESNKRIKELNDDMMDVLDAYSNHGGSVQLVFYNTQNQLISEYQRLNPGVNFHRIEADVEIYPTLKVAGRDTVHSPILNIDIPGISTFKREATEALVLLADADAEPVIRDSLNYKKYGGSISGGLDLDIAGACTLYAQRKLSPSENKGFNSALRANAFYSYGLQTNSSYHAKFNAGQILKVIKEKHTDKGFFRSKSTASLLKEKSIEENLVITLKSNSSDNEFDKSVITDIKTSIVDRILRQVAVGYVPSEVVAPGIPSRGIEDSANAVRKCPHFYCQVAAVALDVIGSFGGGQSSVEKFIENNNAVSEETVSINKMRKFYGSFTFQP